MMNLQKLRTEMNKKYGEYSALYADDLAAESHIPYGVSTGCLTLDLAIGRPGLPAGRLTEIVGMESKGKSSHLYSIFAECQKQSGVAILLESERGYEPERLEALGVKTNDLFLCQPKNMEEAFEMIETNIIFLRDKEKFKEAIVIGIDSVARLVTGAEDEGKYQDHHMGLAARAIWQGMRKLMGPVARKKVVLVFINQLHYTMEKYGDATKSYGGQGIPTSATLRIEIKSRKADREVEKKTPTGMWMDTEIFKNKIAIPYKHAKYFFRYKTGVDKYEDLWQSALVIGILKAASGGNFKFAGKIPIRREKWVDFVENKMKGVDEFKTYLMKQAIEKGLMKLYQ
jgi:recombination protein RecA